MIEGTGQRQGGLQRRLGLFSLILYGAGTILGAGIYVLVGEIIGKSGKQSALSFIIAAIVAAFSAYSFAMLSRRYPVSAGEAAYVQEAFRRSWLAAIVGFAIVALGMTSSATIAHGFYGYLVHFIEAPHWLVSALFVAALTLVAMSGVGFSVGVAAVATVVEVAGLAIVIVSAGDNLGQVLDRPEEFLIPRSAAQWQGIAVAAYLAFYACIGFEDMVNISEEVKCPERNMPLGIAAVLVLTTLLYILVSLAALTSLPVETLANSRAPLALVVEHNGGIPVEIIGIISTIAVTNGALIQIIMGSRVLYGMARRNLAPQVLSRLNSRTGTPAVAAAIVGSIVLVLTLVFPITTLARATTTTVLSVFTLVNLSLLIINIRERNHGFPGLAVPLLGAIICISFMAIQLIQ